MTFKSRSAADSLRPGVAYEVHDRDTGADVASLVADAEGAASLDLVVAARRALRLAPVAAVPGDGGGAR